MRKNRIRGERALHGLTQKELAEKMGVSVACVRKWECGRGKPNADNIVKMARFFGCTADYILGMTEERL